MTEKLIYKLVGVATAVSVAVSVMVGVTFIRRAHIIVQTAWGGSRAIGLNNVIDLPAADHFATNGSEHIAPYIAHLFDPSNDFKSLSVFTADGERGLSLHARNARIEVVLTVSKLTASERERLIRSYFGSRGIKPSQDYLAGNGLIPNATRFLIYPISGSSDEVTAFVRHMLVELCDISAMDGLEIKAWTFKGDARGTS
jgi:hypothetical protein